MVIKTKRNNFGLGKNTYASMPDNPTVKFKQLKFDINIYCVTEPVTVFQIIGSNSSVSANIIVQSNPF